MLDGASKWRELLIKEALHIGLTPVETLVMLDWSYLVVGSLPSRGSVDHHSQGHTLHTEFVLSMCKLSFSIF